MRKDDIQREGMDAGEKVDSTRDSTGGMGREGEGGREGDRARGEDEAVSYRRGGIPTDSDRGGSRDGANVFSEVASLRASNNGLTTAVSTADLTGSTSVPSIWTAGIGCGCGGCGVVEPEGMADVDADGIGDDDGNGEEACSCQYMGSSSCSSSSASKPCWFRAVAACASAKYPAVAPKRRLPEGTLKGLAVDDSWARGSSEAGTDTKTPKSDWVELAELIESIGAWELEGGVNMDEESTRRGEAGGVAGEKSVAKRSSRSGLVGGGGGRGGDPLPAGTGIRGETDWAGEGIRDFGFRSESSVKEREGLG